MRKILRSAIREIERFKTACARGLIEEEDLWPPEHAGNLSKAHQELARLVSHELRRATDGFVPGRSTWCLRGGHGTRQTSARKARSGGSSEQ